MSKTARSRELGLKLWTSSAVHRFSSDSFAPSHRRRKNGTIEPIMKTDSFSSLTKKKSKCPITLMYHDEYAQANHFNLLLPRGSCFSPPLPENTASSVSTDLGNSGNSYAKAVKQMPQTHLSNHI